MENYVQVVGNEIKIAQNVLKDLSAYQEVKKKMDNLEKEIKIQILKAMEENGIKSFENEDVKITYIENTTRETLDTKKIKEAGLYDLFKKESPVKASVRMTYR